MALPDRELWHVLSDPSDKAVGLTSTEKINNNRRLLFFFFFPLKNYFRADFFTSWNHSYCFSVLCDFWLNGSLSVCITEVFSFFWSFVESGILQWSYFLWWILLEFWTALQVWVAHIWRKMSGVSAIWSYL